MFQGKTNGDNIIFGRVLRHKKVESCSEGALALYLLGRFELTGELDAMDFTSNSKWFDSKLLVDSRLYESIELLVVHQVAEAAIQAPGHSLKPLASLWSCHGSSGSPTRGA
jgi:hypothetical protein